VLRDQSPAGTCPLAFAGAVSVWFLHRYYVSENNFGVRELAPEAIPRLQGSKLPDSIQKGMNHDHQEQYKKWQENTLKKSLDKFKERKGTLRDQRRDRGPAGGALPWLRLREESPAPTEDYLEKLRLPRRVSLHARSPADDVSFALWTMRQYAGFSTAEESNKRYRYLLAQGQTGLSVAFDLPTQIGYDADDPIAQGEVGKVGVSISSITTWSSCSTKSRSTKFPHR
jgi:hypothetical protein